MLVSTTGRVIDVFGPYYANAANYDAGIMHDLFQTDKIKFECFFKADDIFIVDRGFNDVLEFLQELGIDVKMPSFLKGKKQHSTQEANKSRLVTKVRWVVEAVNGLIKTWLFFKNIVPNKSIRYIGDDFRAVCALINLYRPPRITSNDNDQEIGNLMLELSEQNNQVKTKAIGN